MVRGLYTAYTGMVNSQHRLDVVSNNLANATTTGYKKEGCTTQSFDAVYGIKIKDATIRISASFRLEQKSVKRIVIGSRVLLLQQIIHTILHCQERDSLRFPLQTKPGRHQRCIPGMGLFR